MIEVSAHRRRAASGHSRRKSFTRFIAQFAIVVLAVGLLSATAQGKANAVGVSADSGATVVSQHRIAPRLYDLKIESPALMGTASVRLLVPEGWDPRSGERWPVLYLLHGCCDGNDYRLWTERTDLEQFFADKNVLVVMPGGGTAGYYSEHWNYGKQDNRPNSEFFHTQELVQILQRGYGADTSRMAVGGLSFAGYGAMHYAANYPQLFDSAASYSGFIDTQMPPTTAMILRMFQRNEHDPYALWGHPVRQWDIWRANNPAAHPERFKGVNVFISVGNGLPGPYDKVSLGGVLENPKPAVLGTTIEGSLYLSARTFVANLRLHGVPVEAHFYGPGRHIWPYWQRELKHSWPTLAKGLGLPA